MDAAVVSRWRRLTRAVVYAVVVAVPLGMLAFLVRSKFAPLVTLDQDTIAATTDYARAHPRFRSFVETWEMISQPWVMSLLVGRARPEIDDPISQYAGFSFPSGHATNNAVVVTVVVVLMWPLVGTGLRGVLVGVGAVWVIVTGADRLYVGAHYLSDVMAGVLLGCGLTAASYAGYVAWTPPTPTTSTTKGSD